MPASKVNRHKILNDPVYGFVTLRHARALDLMDHRYMQRLRRISQLGLSHLVYPGAVHNRFHHAVGCMHLMQEAIDSLRNKGVDISEAEAEGRAWPFCSTTWATARSAMPWSTALCKACTTKT